MSQALPANLNPVARSQDELLSERITAHFFANEAFPENDAHISRYGFNAKPPTPYQHPWQLEDSEQWLAHGLGTYFYQLGARGDFKQAGAAAVLITDRTVRLLLGISSVEKPIGIAPKSRGEKHMPNSHFEAKRWRYLEITQIGVGDLLLLKHWKLEPVILRVPWARSLGAMISGMRLIEQKPLALEDSVVNSRKPTQSKKLENASKLVLEVERHKP